MLMNTQMGTLMSDQAVRPLCAREAVAAELGTVRERAFWLRAKMLNFERKTEGILPVALSPGAGRLEMWRLEAMQQRLGIWIYLTNTASSAQTRFGICLEHSCLDDEVEVVGTWLALLRRPMLVHSVEATACDVGTWLDPLFTIGDVDAFGLMASSSGAVTQHLLSMIPACSDDHTAEFTGPLCHSNLTTTDNQMSQHRAAHRPTGQALILTARRRRAPSRPLSLPLPPPSTPPSLPLAALLSMPGRGAVAEPDEAGVMGDCAFGDVGPPPRDHPSPLPPPEPPPRSLFPSEPPP